MNELPDYITEELLSSYFAHELSEDQRDQIDAWANESSANRALLESYQLIWKDVGTIRLPANIQVDVDEAWAKMNRRTLRSKNNYKFAVAAAVSFLLLAFWLFDDLTKEITRTVTAMDGITKTYLPDSTMVTLNHGASISFKEELAEKEIREVTLKGEAFFNVRHNPKKPFIVLASQARIEVLGTSFNVTVSPKQDTVSLFVQSGQVKFSHLNKAVALTKGQKAVWVLNTRERLKFVNPKGSELYWNRQILIFSNNTLQQVVTQLSNVYGVELSISDTLASCPFSAEFESATLEEVLEILRLTYDLQIEWKKDRIKLIGSGC